MLLRYYAELKSNEQANEQAFKLIAVHRDLIRAKDFVKNATTRLSFLSGRDDQSIFYMTRPISIQQQASFVAESCKRVKKQINAQLRKIAARKARRIGGDCLHDLPAVSCFIVPNAAAIYGLVRLFMLVNNEIGPDVNRSPCSYVTRRDGHSCPDTYYGLVFANIGSALLGFFYLVFVANCVINCFPKIRVGREDSVINASDREMANAVESFIALLNADVEVDTTEENEDEVVLVISDDIQSQLQGQVSRIEQYLVTYKKFAHSAQDKMKIAAERENFIAKKGQLNQEKQGLQSQLEKFQRQRGYISAAPTKGVIHRELQACDQKIHRLQGEMEKLDKRMENFDQRVVILQASKEGIDNLVAEANRSFSSACTSIINQYFSQMGSQLVSMNHYGATNNDTTPSAPPSQPSGGVGQRNSAQTVGEAAEAEYQAPPSYHASTSL